VSIPKIASFGDKKFIVVVDTCPLTKIEGGLNLLHKADHGTVIWLESTATAAFAK